MVSSVFSIRFDEPSLAEGPAVFQPRCRAEDSVGDFIGGSENALLTAAVAVVSDETRAFSPLLFYGPSGVGKSHLLRGFVAAYQSCHASDRCRLMCGTDFARSLSAAIELDSLGELREENCRLNLLAIDDIHELSSKPFAQRELLHTIDVLADRGSLVIAATDATPHELRLLPGLRSRLLSGLSIPITPPKPETRHALASHFATELGLNLSSDRLAELLKSGCLSDCRSAIELQGALLRFTHSGFDSETPALPRSISFRKIIKAVARHFELRPADLAGPSRRQTTVLARGVAVYLMRKLADASFQQIAQSLGGRDHTTALHAFRRTNATIESDSVLRQAVTEICRQLGAPTSI